MIAEKVCSLERWNALCLRLDLSADGEIYSELIEAHAQKHRAYHTLDHIAACLRHLDNVRELTKTSDEIEMALWFHDAVYKPFSSTNEEDSAEWAGTWLQARGAEDAVIRRITDHILATKSHEAPDHRDRRFMLDIDLSILGTAAPVYDRFEKDVRFEYRRVPKFIFRKKRAEILQGFLERERIYATDYFFEKLETQARVNLKRALETLQS